LRWERLRLFGATVLYEAAMSHGDGLHAHPQIGKTMIMITDPHRGRRRKADIADLRHVLQGSDGLGGRSVRPYLGDLDGQRRKDARTGLRVQDGGV
jgi:hypothetical protein